MKNSLSLKELALYGVLGGLTFALKMAMAPLPNIEPVSLMVMLFAVCYGRRGVFPVCVYVLLELTVWGWGLWSLCYLYVWFVLFAAARLLRRRRAPLLWAGVSGCFGLLFGTLYIPVYWATGGWASAVAWWLDGIPMDLLHAGGNFVLALVLFSPLRRCLDTLNRRYGIREETN